MSQSEIIKLLEKNKEMSCEEIAKRLNISIPTIWKNLLSLLKNEEIERISKSKEDVIREGKHFTNRSYIWHIKNE